ncbi:MAG: DUF814 domain-containing protein, partial [Candidatus Sericytochromatia bacterium]|nr:DUF814 domain-containing protein [Candidatus Sericytochromatia bacterium]
SDTLEDYYHQKERQSTFALLKLDLSKIVKKYLDKNHERINFQKQVLEKSEQAEIYKQYGDLIFSNIHNLPENTQSIEIENYYDSNNLLKIELNKDISVSENGQRFFKKYNKLRNSHDISINLIKSYNLELDYLEEVFTSIENSETPENLKEIEIELIEEKYINKTIKQKNNKIKLEKKNLLNIISTDGLEILIGKNNKQNDFLTTKLASENDLWFHTRLIPGSHVILRTDNGKKSLTDNDIIEAATMAARYSKAKYSSNVCVVYTKVKYVKKPAHSKPGFVIYSKEKAVYVNP